MACVSGTCRPAWCPFALFVSCRLGFRRLGGQLVTWAFCSAFRLVVISTPIILSAHRHWLSCVLLCVNSDERFSIMLGGQPLAACYSGVCLRLMILLVALFISAKFIETCLFAATEFEEFAHLFALAKQVCAPQQVVASGARLSPPVFCIAAHIYIYIYIFCPRAACWRSCFHRLVGQKWALDHEVFVEVHAPGALRAWMAGLRAGRGRSVPEASLGGRPGGPQRGSLSTSL